jgi:hypothetical protein
VALQLMGSGNAQSRRPFRNSAMVTWINPSIGNSTYHGGVRAEKRFSGGFFAGALHLLRSSTM